jgi:CRP-like cAMP-binding protein
MFEAARQNRLLSSLPDDDLKRWGPHLRAVPLGRGVVLQESGQPPTYAYFPTSAVVSLIYEASAGAAAEIGMVGNEGVVGALLVASDEAGPPARAMVQSAGWAFRMDAHLLRADLERLAVRDLLWRHAQALITQMAQTAACMRHHPIEQQFCRWLLLCLDRAGGAELITTQATIAAKLGVRRAGISECAHKLQGAGYIRYARGSLTVVDRAGLELKACGCYRVIRDEYRRLLGDGTAAKQTET